MPARKIMIVNDLGMSWGSDEPNYREIPVRDPWADVEEIARNAAIWMFGFAGVMAATHAVVFFLG